MNMNEEVILLIWQVPFVSISVGFIWMI